jgi:hypothetical protein
MWILFASLAVIVAATYLGFDLRTWFRSAPLRREWKARAVTFRTELDWVLYGLPLSPPVPSRDRMARPGETDSDLGATVRRSR